jgi:hypothetical protein
MASSLSQRDFKTAGDGLLTFDSITGREWLDPVHTKYLDVNELYYALKDNGAYAGFTHATAKEIEELISHGGVDASLVGDFTWTLSYNGIYFDADSSSDYSLVSSKPPTTLEVMNDLFKLLDQPSADSYYLYGRSVDNYLYSFLSKQKDGIPYQMAIGSASTSHTSRPFLYKGGDPQILDTNAAPTSISIDLITLYENAANAVVGTLTVTDNDKDDTYTLALAGDDASTFVLKDHTLQLKSGVSADYETQPSYKITVTATDAGGLSKSQPFTIQVTDVPEENEPDVVKTPQNTAPTDISLSNHSIAENVPLALVGTLNVTDPDAKDSHKLTLSGQDANSFSISASSSDGDQLKLQSSTGADFETKSSYNITVTATDSGGLSKSQPFTIKVTDVDEAQKNNPPTEINLSNTTIAENVPLALVGTLSVTDPDAKDSHKLALSGQDANSFYISSSSYTGHSLKWKSNAGADYETQSSYSVTVTATDSGGLSNSQPFTIKVTDVDETTSTDNGDSSTSTDNGDSSTYGGKNTSTTTTYTGKNGEPTTPTTLYGTSGNDILGGFSGYDIIDGKEGLDTAKYSVASTEVSFSENDAGQLVVQNTANASLYSGKNAAAVESDTLISMERIQFSDKNYALDLDGNAGVAAKAVITCFGQDSLDLYMSSALTLADGGSTLDEICELVASMRYIESTKRISTNSSFVDFIFENVAGRPPNFLESSKYTQFLDDGAYTKGSLLTLAAKTSLVDKLLTESAVDLIGVSGSADGEILALQYDLGLG